LLLKKSEPKQPALFLRRYDKNDGLHRGNHYFYQYWLQLFNFKILDFMKSIALLQPTGQYRLRSRIILMIFFLFIILLFTSCDKDDLPSDVQSNLQLIATNLVSPLSVVESPDGTKRLFIVDQSGKIYIVPNGGTMLPAPFLDISSKMVTLGVNYDERGLLSMAFHPNYQINRRFYVFYTALPRPGGPGTGWNNLTRISEFTASVADPNLADLASEKIILEADHPQGNHNGGTIAFGPDGFLYISIGDGGGSNDVGNGHVDDWYLTNAGGNAQNIWANLMGKILRIDVNSGSPYAIPADNPYANSSYAKKEIYAFGFRNPYRFSFDMGGNRGLYVGDAGQVLWEEVDVVVKGGNYGWNIKEGQICFNTDDNKLPRATCPVTDTAGNPLVDPVIVIKNKAHPDGTGAASTVVGGNVYRGNTFPQLQGKYIFGIFSQGNNNVADAKLYVSNIGGSGSWSYETLTPKDYQTNLGYYLKGFGQDLSGEIYLAVSSVTGLSGTNGKIFKLVAAQ
jgi:glucose/arabinose dehydrogenase